MVQRLIDANALILKRRFMIAPDWSGDHDGCAVLVKDIYDAPVVEAIPAEKYDELREMFVDYVCSGITNPAPYCKNRCAECLDSYGWCRHGDENCAGFDPDKEG